MSTSPLSTILKTGVAAAALAGVFAASAHAGGFQLSQYSARDFGLANSGGAALADDASTIFTNPAGMTRLQSMQALAGVHGVFGDGSFQNAGSTDALGAPLQGTDGDSLYNDSFIPAAFFAAPLMDGQLWVGLGVTAPFGLNIEYPDNSMTRYQNIRTELRVIDINPSVGWRVNDWLSVGLGVSAQYADATLGSAIDFGAACLAQVEPVAPGTCVATGLLPQQADGRVTVEGDDWSYGWNAGVMLTPAEGTRIGLAYRSAIDHTLTGDSTFEAPPAAQAVFNPAFTDAGGSADLALPDRWSVSLYHQITERFAMTGDVTWTRWSRLQELVVEFDNPAQPDSGEVLGYRNGVRAAIGGEYQTDWDVTLRAGLAFDQGPSTAETRSARAPDSDRVVAALGASWAPVQNWIVDLGYQRIFFDDALIDQVGPAGERLVGEFDNKANVVGLSLRWVR